MSEAMAALTEAVLLGALKHYGSHKITCTMKDVDCTCGFTALMARTSPAAKELVAREGELVAALEAVQGDVSYFELEDETQDRVDATLGEKA